MSEIPHPGAEGRLVLPCSKRPTEVPLVQGPKAGPRPQQPGGYRIEILAGDCQLCSGHFEASSEPRFISLADSEGEPETHAEGGGAITLPSEGTSEVQLIRPEVDPTGEPRQEGEAVKRFVIEVVGPRNKVLWSAEFEASSEPVLLRITATSASPAAAVRQR